MPSLHAFQQQKRIHSPSTRHTNRTRRRNAQRYLRGGGEMAAMLGVDVYEGRDEAGEGVEC